MEKSGAAGWADVAGAKYTQIREAQSTEKDGMRMRVVLTGEWRTASVV